MNKQQQTAADLRAAARYIEEHGWYQGDWEFNGRVCAVGAIGTVIVRTLPAYARISLTFTRVDPSALERYDTAYEALATTIGTKQVGRWNDNSERVVTDVLTAFEKAALLVEEQA